MSVRNSGSVPGGVKSFFSKANNFVCSETRICTGRYEVFLQKGKLLCLFGNQDLYREIESLSSERQIALSVRKPGFVPGDRKSFFRKANCFVCSELRICTGRYELFLQKGKLLCLFGNQDLYREIGSLSSERQIALSVRNSGSVPGDMSSFFRKANCFVRSETRICTGRYEVFLQKGKLLCLFGNQDLYREI